MKLIAELKAYYPHFGLCDEPRAIECVLRAVEGEGGRMYVKTPFAMLDMHGSDPVAALQSEVNGRSYYATKEECEAYLAGEYPHWKEASPIMDALDSSRIHYGKLVGDGRIADKIGVSPVGLDLYHMARGHRSMKPKAIKAAVAALKSK